MKAEELALDLERAGALLCALGLSSDDGEVLYTLVRGRDGEVSVTIRCGEDCVLSAVEDVVYVGRTNRGLKVHLRGGSGSVSMLTLGPGRRKTDTPSRRRTKGGGA